MFLKELSEKWADSSIMKYLCGLNVWHVQFISCLISVVVIFLVLTWNYFFLPTPFVCGHEPYDPWVKKYSLFVLGASLGQTFLQFFRVLISYFGFSDGKLRHPYATGIILIMCSNYSLQIFLFYSGWIPYTCRDIFGARTPFTFWIEAITITPFMFFLVSMMDVKRTQMKPIDWQLEIYSIIGFTSLTFANFDFNNVISLLFFLGFQVLEPSAFKLQTELATEEYLKARKEYSEISTQEITKTGTPNHQKVVQKTVIDHTAFRSEIYDRFQVAKYKMISSVFLERVFLVYGINFMGRYLGFYDDNVLIVIFLIVSFFQKMAFIQILIDSHVEILDPNKFLLIEERKKFDETRLMFFRYIFHEIRVPLNSISLGLQLLQDNKYLTKEDHESLTMMKEAAVFMGQTLNDVLSLQKIEAGMLTLEYKFFIPKDLIDSTLMNFRPQYESKNIDIISCIAENVPNSIYGDYFRLEHVLANLLSNAIKFSDPGSLIEISVGYENKMKEHVTFTVKDQGIGMTAEDQKSLFQPFKQIRPGELQKGRGSGLGLSICKMIIDLHHGFIGCNSHKRIGDDITTGGSEFYFSIAHHPDEIAKLAVESAASTSPATVPSTALPSPDKAGPPSVGQPIVFIQDDPNHSPRPNLSIKTQSNTEEENDNKKNPEKEISLPQVSVLSPTAAQIRNAMEISNLNQPVATNATISTDSSISMESTTDKPFPINHILIVDDVLSNRKMLEMILKRKGYPCEQCEDGSDAVKLVEEKGVGFYDIIFMDSLMPIMNGQQATRCLRTLGYKHFIVGVTGNAGDTDTLEFENAGADLVLAKPMNMVALQCLLDFAHQHGCHSYFHEGNIPAERTLKNWVENCPK